MLLNQPIQLKVSTRRDFLLPVCVLYGLVVLAALLSPQPVLLTVIVVLFFAAGWRANTLGISKTNNTELTSIIFPDGRLRLESGRKVIFEGLLNGQQWCTRHFAVLRVADGGISRVLVVRSAQQQAKDDFRRLNMWLRQDLCNNRGKQVVDS